MKFYGAEVLLALEYLHGCGFVYRGLLWTPYFIDACS